MMNSKSFVLTLYVHSSRTTYFSRGGLEEQILLSLENMDLHKHKPELYQIAELIEAHKLRNIVHQFQKLGRQKVFRALIRTLEHFVLHDQLLDIDWAPAVSERSYYLWVFTVVTVEGYLGHLYVRLPYLHFK